MRLSGTRKNIIKTINGVAKRNGQLSKFAKFMFVRGLTSPWIDGFNNTLAQMLTSIKPSHIKEYFLHTKSLKVKVGQGCAF